MMGFEDVFKKRRSIRKFAQEPIPRNILLDCIDAARLSPSSRNYQPLEYVLALKNSNLVFSCTSWAGSAPEAGPKQGEEPTAYIVILSNTLISQEAKVDAGIAAAHIVLAAAVKGIASCIQGSVDRDKLVSVLSIPSNYNVELVVALGYPNQRSVVEETTNTTKYWLDEMKVLHVPKRPLRNIVHEERF